MSGRAMEDAWRASASLPSGPARLLLGLAYHANARTTLCFPSLATLAAEAGMTRSQAQRNVRHLVEAGFVTITVPHKGHRSPRYRLNLEGTQGTPRGSTDAASGTSPRGRTDATSGQAADARSGSVHATPGVAPVLPERSHACDLRDSAHATSIETWKRNKEGNKEGNKEAARAPAHSGHGLLPEVPQEVLNEFLALREKLSRCAGPLTAKKAKKVRAAARAAGMSVEGFVKRFNAQARTTSTTMSLDLVDDHLYGPRALLSEVDEQTLDNYLALRDEKHLPLTVAAATKLRRQAELDGVPIQDAIAECCRRGMVGFKASWSNSTPHRAREVGGVV